MSQVRGTDGALDAGVDARFCELYRHHAESIRDYCRRRVDAEAVDDAVAEV